MIEGIATAVFGFFGGLIRRYQSLTALLKLKKA